MISPNTTFSIERIVQGELSANGKLLKRNSKVYISGVNLFFKLASRGSLTDLELDDTKLLYGKTYYAYTDCETSRASYKDLGEVSIVSTNTKIHFDIDEVLKVGDVLSRDKSSDTTSEILSIETINNKTYYNLSNDNFSTVGEKVYLIGTSSDILTDDILISSNKYRIINSTLREFMGKRNLKLICIEI